jgi:hypothetical protein
VHAQHIKHAPNPKQGIFWINLENYGTLGALEKTNTDLEKTKTEQLNLLAEYWKHAVALYVRNKRQKLAKGQKEVRASRSTLSLIENAKHNFTLEALLEVLEAVGGNISEAFHSHIPKSLHGEDQALHEILQQILDTKDPEAVKLVEFSLKAAYERYVERSSTVLPFKSVDRKTLDTDRE